MNFKPTVLKTGLALILATFVIGCASNNSVTQNNAVTLIAENTQEGILLSFSHIPPETTRMFIHLMEINENANPVPVFADLQDIPLESVKESGKVLCPFAENGRHYFVSVTFEVGDNDEYAPENWAMAEITADNGIHALNKTALELNDTETGVALSAEPDFSADVEYAEAKFRYMVTVKVNDYGSIAYGEPAMNELAWNFLPAMLDDFKKDKVEASGNLPAYVTAYCNLNYGNILWVVGIANSREFIVSL